MLLHTCTQLAKPRQTTLNFNFADRKCVAQNVVHSLGSGILPKMRNFTFCIFLAPQFTNIACHFKHTHHTQHTHTCTHTHWSWKRPITCFVTGNDPNCVHVCVCVFALLFLWWKNLLLRAGRAVNKVLWKWKPIVSGFLLPWQPITWSPSLIMSHHSNDQPPS